jgi:beta-alanine degradation protein BauB
MKTLISSVCFTIISWAAAAAQDAVKVAPENYKVLLNNTHVQVLDFTLKPGQRSPMVARPNRVIYAITPATGKLTGSDGKTTTMRRKAGEAWWRDAESLAVENTGKTEIHTVVVELKK